MKSPVSTYPVSQKVLHTIEQLRTCNLHVHCSLHFLQSSSQQLSSRHDKCLTCTMLVHCTSRISLYTGLQSSSFCHLASYWIDIRMMQDGNNLLDLCVIIDYCMVAKHILYSQTSTHDDATKSDEHTQSVNQSLESLGYIIINYSCKS